jgi:AbrB family looped-hinge helix DNA binding protein
VSRATISTKYQVVIPKDIRAEVPVHQGQQVEVIAKGGVITLVPLRPLREMRGFVRGVSSANLRDKEDRI